jgi:hypothetical protein
MNIKWQVLLLRKRACLRPWVEGRKGGRKKEVEGGGRELEVSGENLNGPSMDKDEDLDLAGKKGKEST